MRRAPRSFRNSAAISATSTATAIGRAAWKRHPAFWLRATVRPGTRCISDCWAPIEIREQREGTMKVAFLGLGVMGFPMAGHLKKAGHDVTVYNRSSAKAAKWVETHAGKSAATPREAAKDNAIVFACVGNDDDLRSVVLGVDGAFAGMAKGALFVDHTTASAEVARELAAAGGKL